MTSLFGQHKKHFRYFRYYFINDIFIVWNPLEKRRFYENSFWYGSLRIYNACLISL